MTEPSAETALAKLPLGAPGISPRPTMPVAAIQRKVSAPCDDDPRPTTIDPSADTSDALIYTYPPGKSPRAIAPSAVVHRIASVRPSIDCQPTMTLPSADKAFPESKS